MQEFVVTTHTGVLAMLGARDLVSLGTYCERAVTQGPRESWRCDSS